MRKSQSWKFGPWLHYLWKVPLCGLLFFGGFIPGSLLATWLGLPTPSMPAGADPAVVMQYTLAGSLLLALGLAVLAQGLSGEYLARWLILFFFTWVVYGVNTYLEAAIFSTLSAASLFTVVLYFPAALLCSAGVAWLFPSPATGSGFVAKAQSFLASRTRHEWAWCLLLAYLAFPLAYLFFGTLIAPIVTDYYRQGVGELALPGWGQILPVLALRSFLFLLVCLPVLIAWQLSNRRLFLTLGLVLFILVGGLGLLEAYWLPSVLRMVHSLEILADELVYAGALVLLLQQPRSQSQSD